MSKFNVAGARTSVPSAIKTETTPSGKTFEGAAGYARDEKSELFLLAVTNMVGEKTFYEAAGDRDERYLRLIKAVAVADPAWLLEMTIWLRNGANMRTAAVVMGIEGAKALVEAKIDTTKLETSSPRLNMGPGAARLLASAGMARADEPGEAIAYWHSRYGKKMPTAIKRGIGDAVLRLYNEYSLLKYDTPGKAFRFGRVIDLVHPGDARGGSSQHFSFPGQSQLFKYALDRMRGKDVAWSSLASLPMIEFNRALRVDAAEDPTGLLNADLLKKAGMNWEDVLSLAGSKIDKKHLWEAMILNMGYMALLRNLRNFDQAGVSDAVAAYVITKLQDAEEVARSRQLPLRFLSAYRNAPNLRWSYPLELALQHSLKNIPVVGGKTLILVDTSGSMHSSMSDRSELLRWDAATTFGLALAQRCQTADVVSFSTDTKVFPLVKGESLLKSIARWKSGGFFQGGGTYTSLAVRRHYATHDRVIILTDEQAHVDYHGSIDDAVPKNKFLFTFNLAGYARGHTPSGMGTRHTFGGLTDQMFGLIRTIERGSVGSWPWEMTDDC